MTYPDASYRSSYIEHRWNISINKNGPPYGEM